MKIMKLFLAVLIVVLSSTAAQAVPLPYWVCVKFHRNVANNGQAPNYSTVLAKLSWSSDRSEAEGESDRIADHGFAWLDSAGQRHSIRPAQIDDVYVAEYDYNAGTVCTTPTSLAGERPFGAR